MPAVVAAGMSCMALWRLRQAGEFPAPVRPGGDGSRADGLERQQGSRAAATRGPGIVVARCWRKTGNNQ